MNSKRITTVFPVLMLFTTLVSGQEEKPSQYLFEQGKIAITGFGGPFVEFSGVRDEFGTSAGGGGAVLLNQTFFFGGYGLGLATMNNLGEITLRENNHSPLVTYTNPMVTFGHGGFWLGYINNHQELVHWGVSSKFGWGAVGIFDNVHDINRRNEMTYDQVFVLTPQAEVEVNLFRWFKINLGLGYRLVSGIDKTYLDANGNNFELFKSNDFNSPVGTISFLFGGFGQRNHEKEYIPNRESRQ